ncbi:hypothetical protein JCM33374_g4313 [Metschnikowia sp. JCM 33374]|nr:hypothetical protein JCM33374_g4313 [Metschnikowia sp. JCM 33374]
MGKRKSEAFDRRQKKARSESDELLTGGVFIKNRHNNNSEDDTEHDYELTPRTLNVETGVDALPIKRAGKVERVVRETKPKEESDHESDAEPFNEPEEPKNQDAEPDSDDELTPMEKLQKIKAEVAQYASSLMEDPEENIENLGKLRKLTESDNIATSQLAILALIPVFKSLAPAYKIRPLTEAEQRERVGKEIARLRKFEQNLVVNYRDYITLLTRLARVSASNSQNSHKVTPQQVRLGEIATKAACELCLSSLRFFNYRDELFTIPIRRLNRKPTVASDLEVFTRCLRALETLLKEDRDHGSITFDVTRIMCKVIRDKKFRVDEAVVNVFLSLSLLDDYDPNNNKGEEVQKIKKKNRVHLSKKQKKMRKELKEIDEEMRKAEQTVTAEERERFQSQTLKHVLTLYLEILKAGSLEIDENSTAKLLTAAVMEGLSRFGQMSNFDLLGDFLVVLKETMSNIVQERTLQTTNYGIVSDNDDDESGGVFSAQDVRKLLLCITAAFTLVLNHGEIGRLPISFDLLTFVSTLYTVLADISISPDLEFSHKSLRLADPLSFSGEVEKPAVNVSTNAELLLKSLDMVFFRSRNGSVARAMPFTKRLYLASLHAPEKTTIASLKFVAKLINKYGNALKGLWSTEENISGEGNYILGYEKTGMEVDLERSNVGSAVLWENVLLDKHYSSVIKDGSRSLMKNSKDTNAKR